jgi:hypothetical protein
MDDNYLAFHPHLLIDREPTLGKRERQVSSMFYKIMEDIKAARERAAEEAETE